MVSSPLTTRYFQDVDPTSIDPSTHATFVIEWLLELGDEAAIDWLKAEYPIQTIQAVLRTSRRISPLSANFFALELDVPREEIWALRPPNVKRWKRPSSKIWLMRCSNIAE